MISDSLRFGLCEQTDLVKCLPLASPLTSAANLLMDVEDDDRWCLDSGLESLKCSYVTGECARDDRTRSHTDDPHKHTNCCCVLPRSIFHNPA